MVQIILARKFKKEAVHKAVNRISSRKKNHRMSQNHYQIKGKVYGHWADDWLTAWQTKNEG